MTVGAPDALAASMAARSAATSPTGAPLAGAVPTTPTVATRTPTTVSAAPTRRTRIGHLSAEPSAVSGTEEPLYIGCYRLVTSDGRCVAAAMPVPCARRHSG